ncbi:hypothetical protein ACSQ67_001782 [Phaseolus vulgaris]
MRIIHLLILPFLQISTDSSFHVHVHALGFTCFLLLTCKSQTGSNKCRMGNNCVGSKISDYELFSCVLPSSFVWLHHHHQTRVVTEISDATSLVTKIEDTNALENVQEKAPRVVKISKEINMPSEPAIKKIAFKVKRVAIGLQEESILKRKSVTGDIFRDVVGSPYYIAPEVLRRHYGPEADVWSAGVIIYILLCGTAPFWGESEQEIFEEVLHGDLDFTSDPWPNISESARDLVRKMLVRDPRKRITAHEVLRHPWIQVDGVAPDMPLDSAVLSRLKQFSVMNKLKKMALRVIAENLSEEEISELKVTFKMIDTDNSGQITLEKLKAGLKRLGNNLSEPEILDLMQAADVDNSGTIDYGEFIAATLHLNKVDREDLLVAAFSFFDRSGSGYITQDELQKACEEFGIENVCFEEVIQEADQNNDGRIDYDEFVAMMLKGNADLGRNRIKGDTDFSIGFREALSVC